MPVSKSKRTRQRLNRKMKRLHLSLNRVEEFLATSRTTLSEKVITVSVQQNDTRNQSSSIAPLSGAKDKDVVIPSNSTRSRGIGRAHRKLIEQVSTELCPICRQKFFGVQEKSKKEKDLREEDRIQEEKISIQVSANTPSQAENEQFISSTSPRLIKEEKIDGKDALNIPSAVIIEKNDLISNSQIPVQIKQEKIDDQDLPNDSSSKENSGCLAISLPNLGSMQEKKMNNKASLNVLSAARSEKESSAIFSQNSKSMKGEIIDSQAILGTPIPALDEKNHSKVHCQPLTLRGRKATSQEYRELLDVKVKWLRIKLDEIESARAALMRPRAGSPGKKVQIGGQPCPEISGEDCLVIQNDVSWAKFENLDSMELECCHEQDEWWDPTLGINPLQK